MTSRTDAPPQDEQAREIKMLREELEKSLIRNGEVLRNGVRLSWPLYDAERARADKLEKGRDIWQGAYQRTVKSWKALRSRAEAAEAQVAALKESLAGAIRWIELICHEAGIDPDDTTIDVRANGVVVATLDLAESLDTYRARTSQTEGK